MTGLVINVGDVPYAQDALAVIRNFFEFNNTPLVVLEEDLPQNKHGSHPSWLKTFCHDIIDDDFILSWDLDLIPNHRYSLSEFVKDRSQFHIGIECGLLYGWPMSTYGPKFKYNCGFMGIPKSFGPILKNIYEKFGHNPQNRDCWEQLYINDYLVDNDVDVHIVRPEYNCSLNTRLEFLPNVKNCHYTYGVMDPFRRAALIKEHRERYFNQISEGLTLLAPP